MTVADQVEGAVEEPDPVGIHFALALFLSAHGVIDHLDGLSLERRLVDPVDDLLEPGVILVGLDAHLKGLLDALEVLHGFRRQGGLDLLRQGFQGVMESRALEGFEHVRAEVECHELCEAEGNGDVVLQGVQQGPEVFPVHPLGVNREPCHLEGFQIPVDGPGMAFEIACQFRRRFPLLESDQGLDDLPLPCQLVAPLAMPYFLFDSSSMSS